MNNEHTGPQTFPLVNMNSEQCQAFDAELEQIFRRKELGYLAIGIWFAGIAFQNEKGHALAIHELRAIHPIHHLTIAREIELLEREGYATRLKHNETDSAIFHTPSTKQMAYDAAH